VSTGKESRTGEFAEKVVKVRRCATVVKGGRRFSFAGLVVVGNGRGKVGCGYAKANEVPPAVEKAIKDGMKNLVEIPVESGTIPHRVEGRAGTAKVILLPASPGTGIIAGGGVRTFNDVREYGWAGADAASLGSEAWLKPLWSMPLAPLHGLHIRRLIRQVEGWSPR